MLALEFIFTINDSAKMMSAILQVRRDMIGAVKICFYRQK